MSRPAVHVDGRAAAFAVLVFGCICATTGYAVGDYLALGARLDALEGRTTTPQDAAVAILKIDESFRGMPYPDAGGQAIGYGTDLPITKEEGALLLEHRLSDNWTTVMMRWPSIADAPASVVTHLMAMAYQLGPEGLLGFTDMRAAIDREDWHAAADAALDSEWARETPHRAQELADSLRAL